MLSEQEIELAHPDAFDFVFGNLPSAERVDVQPPSHRLPPLPGRRRRVQRDRRDHPAASPARRTARRPRRPDGRRHGHAAMARAKPDPAPVATPAFPPGHARRAPVTKTRPSPGSTRYLSASLVTRDRLHPSLSSGLRPSPRPRSARRRRPANTSTGRAGAPSGRWSLACPYGGATAAAWSRWWPRPPPSSSPRSSSRSALAVARSPPSKPPSSSRSMPPRRPS